MRLLFIVLLLALVSNPAFADKNTQLEKAVKKELQDELRDVDHKGKPANPGAKGQANAAYKKATNPGQGAGKNKGVNELFDDNDKNDKKNKNKKKDKDKQK